MKQLGILDSAFVNLEQPNTPQHVGGLGIYDPSTAPGGFVRFKQVIANFEQRLNRQPLFRTRLVEVPGGVDRPYWVKDANFDVEFHLRHIALPQPGDWRQLCIQVARLHARPLDMARPLWECYVIEGLDNIPSLPKGSFAVYTKMHHSLVDGAGGASFMAALHDLEANPSPQPDDAEQPLLVDRDPSAAELLGRAGFNQAKHSVAMARGAVGLSRDMGRFAVKLLHKQVPMPDVQAPKTRFNGPVGPYRVFEATAFPIADFKAVKNATGVKLNDVGLAVVGGALARYLDSKQETPEGSLAAGLPVNLRTRRAMTEDNNQVGSIFASLHTDVRDPVERLKAIHMSTSEAKEFGESSPMLDTIKAAGVLTPAFTRAVASLWSKRNLSKFIPLNVSTVITNVPGPNFDLFCAGARMVQYQGLGLLTPGVGLFHTIFSQAETVNMSVLGDRDIMPDPHFYMQCLSESWEELRDAVLTPARKTTGRKRTARTQPTPVKNRAPAAKKAPGAKKAPAAKKTSSTNKSPSTKKAPAARETAPARKAPAARKTAAARKAATRKKAAASNNASRATSAAVATPSARKQAQRAAAVKRATANTRSKAAVSKAPMRPVAVASSGAPRLRPRRKTSGVAPKLKVVSG
ncbi:MAG: wax ester/triacylglycerol synthase family O-acyltransferase [Pseudomonadota bacterium]